MRAVKVKLIFLLILALALLPQEGKGGLREKIASCAERFAKVEPSASVEPVRKLIARPGNLVWEEGKKRPERVEEALAHLIALTPKEKSELLKELKATHPNLNDVPDLLRIGLNDESGWMKFYRESSSEPERFPRMLLGLRPLTEQIPEATRLKILKDIASRYPTAKKMAPGSSPGNLWPKRLLDGWLRVLLKGDDTFRNAIAAKKTPLQAYQVYLDQMRREVLKNMPDGGGSYGRLSAKDIRGIAKRIQEYLNAPKSKIFIDNVMDDGEVLKPRVRLFGSTIKGLNKNGSDLDMGTEFIRHEFNLGVDGFPGLAPALEKYMADHHPGVKLNFRGDPHTIHQVDSILTPLEPFMVEISPDSVDLLVYSRNVNVDMNAPVSHRASLKTDAPERYSLDSP